jgi:hypothetical protein
MNPIFKAQAKAREETLEKLRARKYFFHTDPGHGWLEVSRLALALVGVEEDISPCSYQSLDGRTAYLEEDCDCSLYFRALGFDPVNGPRPALGPDKHQDEDSFIRDLPRFQA